MGTTITTDADDVGAASWFAACQAFAAEHGAERWLEPLQAFDRAPLDGPDDFGVLESQVGGLPIAPRLMGEVDFAQARMFQRRFEATLLLLNALPLPAARLLRVGLHRRMLEILADRSPRGLRVRACTDFFYSQGALLHHARPEAPEPWNLAREWTAVAAGVEHARVKGLSRLGPVHLNLLRVKDRQLACLDARGVEGGLPEVVRLCNGVAGVSGGFFLYSEPDIIHPSRRTDPVGLLVSEGHIENLPVFRRAALVDGRIRVVDMESVGIAHNDPSQLGIRPVAFNRAFGPQCPDHPGESAAIVGMEIVARGQGAMDIPLAGCVVCGPLPEELDFDGQEAISGGPMLLHAGAPVMDLMAEDFAGSAPPVTFSQDETFDQNLLPRMAVGESDQGLIFIAVDGRDFERAPGFTLATTARFLSELGCHTAMNLDGGSSKRMVVGQDVVDLPSTEIRSGDSGPQHIRPVHSAIVVL
jgi:hypothetical protein